MSSMFSKAEKDEEILIIGAGVFGLSTALSLLNRSSSHGSRKVTVVDSAPVLPNPSGSSVDASRIVRADYACKPYAALAVAAQKLWRDTSETGWGGSGRYHEPGFVITADGDGSEAYVRQALANVRDLAADGVDGIELGKIEVLDGPEQIQRATRYDGVSGRWGYANWNSGWADAGSSVAFALKRLKKEGGERITLRSGCQVERLLFEGSDDGGSHKGRKCVGAQLRGGEKIMADLTVVAAGAWSPSLLDLQGRCLATGQALTYIDISDEEQKAMEDRPTIMNMSRGMFIIPPRGRKLKIARHGFGYRNMEKTPNGSDSAEEVSVPRVGIPVPVEAEEACREALRELLPQMADRPFTHTRICWYCDTPEGDFVIDHHPNHGNLFIATGGSGHGFKFFPVIGDKIVDAIERKLDPDLQQMWRWRENSVPGFAGCEDGSRAGRREMMLNEEIERTS